MQEDATPTIVLDELDEQAQAEIEQDSDEHCLWYAEPRGDGTYTMHGIEANLRDLFDAQGGPKPGWVRVVYQHDDES